ncbi:MAG: hypothetical protein IPL71_11805 [Anaerolineales bacterium]|uniref:hypothetical protein n=1 Tax=Candidatus Villigracilis proximus TaxID=3140683 RepID=UPI00313754E0|nr:hypothetical protein [Anaerolineales bacterium]
MNFDYSNVLTRAAQLSWKHKSIWGLLLLPIVTGFLPFAVFIVLFLIRIMIANAELPAFVDVIFVILFFLSLIFFGIFNYVVRAATGSAATLGVARADRGKGSTRFMDLLRDGLPYFWRVLGLMLIVNLTVGLALTLFNLLMFILIVVTIGMASICLQPILILLMPLVFLMSAVLEAAQAAIFMEEMSVMDALKHALHVVRAHFWKYVIITMVIYFGSSILSSFLITPLMMPLFVFPFLLEFGQEMSLQGTVLIALFFFCIFFPAIILLSSFLGVFMKTALNLTYRRLSPSLLENRESGIIQ